MNKGIEFEHQIKWMKVWFVNKKSVKHTQSDWDPTPGKRGVEQLRSKRGVEGYKTMGSISIGIP